MVTTLSGSEMILAALLAGASAGTASTASKAVQDAYEGLKALVRSRFEARQWKEHPSIEMAETSALDPEVVRAFDAAGLADDAEVLHAAQVVLSQPEVRKSRARVFVSHRASDAVTARTLAEDFEARGIPTWLDAWEINIGDSIVERINDGLASVEYVVVCYSAEGVSSPWMGREWMSTLARQLEGRSVRLLPAMLPGGQVPEILADLLYADLANDWDHGVNQLLAAMR
ncbi:toll/interleukin-1 receptor domain-containing protein [Glycomyces sp. A-F 0318]|uniref:toll/interleukin-1 receptor domain-containing protein n=1 Tax=Glycomyces amatae TaxID=2881355 RepID=UPI001E2C0642|nr:toll/interleukin-1 receptor domain-containing protein [Glycomyces amatae]MCD0444307.1 toll/interleukin-1 receptor domain-containing protein [Glycomyces amatae]